MNTSSSVPTEDDMNRLFNPAPQGTVDERTSLMEQDTDAVNYDSEPDTVRFTNVFL